MAGGVAKILFICLIFFENGKKTPLRLIWSGVSIFYLMVSVFELTAAGMAVVIFVCPVWRCNQEQR